MRLAPDGTFNENFLIKGNNLIALHALKRRYRGKVKLIYIDPPYNTGNDSFNYNDRFNHSVWLSFMKNRLEVARELLRDDGVIFVHLDYNEVHYAKVLMDEIFGRDNFQREIIWRIGWLSGYKTAAQNFIRNHDTILFYSKNSNQMSFNKKYIQNNEFKEIVKLNTLKDILSKYKLDKQQLKDIHKKINYETRIEKYPIEDCWNCNEYDDLNSIAIVSFSGESVSKMLGTDEIKGQKSEKLIQRIIESTTQENDLVLDFFAGSGTTCAVAHKMKRRFIGIEQMDYIQNITLERLKKVIDGEQGGISKAVSWQGGGSVIYAELMPLNALFKDKINKASTLDELNTVFQEMQDKACLEYAIDREKLSVILSEAKRNEESLNGDSSPTAQNDALVNGSTDAVILSEAKRNEESLNGDSSPTAQNDAVGKTQRLRLAPDGTFNENFLIKGNNLIALHALKRRYRGKVKLIYIDPPYNTGNDSFNYNDRFNHSVWLSFMKNRLEVARELLRDDGVIFVHLDYNEVHYAKVLMDEIFGRDNFQREIIWRIGWLSGYKTAAQNFIRNHDTILFYSKNSNQMSFNKKYIQNNEFKEIVKLNTLKDILSKYKLDKQQLKDIHKKINYETRIEKYPIEDCWNCNEYDDLNSIAIVSFSGESVSKMLGTDEIKGQKSEKLIQRIIESTTQENDLVLDFFAGSGTTCAVAHKMKRRFIGIEQMDYIQNITLERLKKVIDGEQGGISKAVSWQGGGSVIYAELMPLNALFKDKINKASTLDELNTVFQEMQDKACLEYAIDREKLSVILSEAKRNEESLNGDSSPTAQNDEAGQNDKLAELKALLKTVFDSNMDYVLYGDIDDAEYEIDTETKAFNEEFYEDK